MAKKHFISIMLVVCMIMGTITPVFANTENENAALSEDKVIIDLTKEDTADNFFTLRNDHASGFFDDPTKREQAWATSTVVKYGNQGVSAVWDKMDDYGLYAHTAYPSDPDNSSNSSYNNTYTGIPIAGAYVNSPEAFSDGQWINNSSKKIGVRSPRRNKILLAAGKYADDFDLENYSFINLVLYNDIKTNERIRITLMEGGTGKFYYDFYLDWEDSWKTISIPVSGFTSSNASNYVITDSAKNKVTNFSLENRGTTNSFNARVNNENAVYISKVYMTNTANTLDIISNPASRNFTLSNSHVNGFYNTKDPEWAWETVDAAAYGGTGNAVVWDKMNHFGLYAHTGPVDYNDNDLTEPTEGAYVNNVNAVTDDGKWQKYNNETRVRSAKRNKIFLNQTLHNSMDFDLEKYQYINFVLYSDKRTNEKIRVELTDGTGKAKFQYTFKLNWEDEWKIVSIPVSAFTSKDSSKYTVNDASTNTVTRFTLENRGTNNSNVAEVDNENKVLISKVYMSKELGDGCDVELAENIDISIETTTCTVVGNEINGFDGMTVESLKNDITVKEKVLFDVYNADGTRAADEDLCVKGMYIRTQDDSNAQSMKYTLNIKDFKLGEINYRVDGNVMQDGKFNKGMVKAWIDIDAYTPTSAAIAIYYYKGDQLVSSDATEDTSIEGIAQRLEASINADETTEDTKIEIMVWKDIDTQEPLMPALVLTPINAGTIESLSKTYPNYSQKAITFSYDDGNGNDSTFIGYLNKYNLKGTFNIIANLYDSKDKDLTAQFNAIYDDHEIATHSYSHTAWADFATPSDAIEDFQTAQDKIKAATGKAPEGGAYPYGAPYGLPDLYNPLLEAFQGMGIKYMRPTSGKGNDFSLPNNWLDWKPNCHHDGMESLADEFLALNTENELKLFYVWGHSFEFMDTYEPGETGKVRFNDLDRLLGKFNDRNAVWAATNIEIYNYAEAMKKATVNYETCTISNPSDIDLCFIVNGTEKIKVPAGENLMVFESQTDSLTITGADTIYSDPISVKNYQYTATGASGLNWDITPRNSGVSVSNTGLVSVESTASEGTYTLSAANADGSVTDQKIITLEKITCSIEGSDIIYVAKNGKYQKIKYELKKSNGDTADISLSLDKEYEGLKIENNTVKINEAFTGASFTLKANVAGENLTKTVTVKKTELYDFQSDGSKTGWLAGTGGIPNPWVTDGTNTYLNPNKTRWESPAIISDPITSGVYTVEFDFMAEANRKDNLMIFSGANNGSDPNQWWGVISKSEADSFFKYNGVSASSFNLGWNKLKFRFDFDTKELKISVNDSAVTVPPNKFNYGGAAFVNYTFKKIITYIPMDNLCIYSGDAIDYDITAVNIPSELVIPSEGQTKKITLDADVTEDSVSVQNPDIEWSIKESCSFASISEGKLIYDHNATGSVTIIAKLKNTNVTEEKTVTFSAPEISFTLSADEKLNIKGTPNANVQIKIYSPKDTSDNLSKFLDAYSDTDGEATIRDISLNLDSNGDTAVDISALTLGRYHVYAIQAGSVLNYDAEIDIKKASLFDNVSNFDSPKLDEFLSLHTSLTSTEAAKAEQNYIAIGSKQSALDLMQKDFKNFNASVLMIKFIEASSYNETLASELKAELEKLAAPSLDFEGIKKNLYFDKVMDSVSSYTSLAAIADDINTNTILSGIEYYANTRDVGYYLSKLSHSGYDNSDEYTKGYVCGLIAGGQFASLQAVKDKIDSILYVGNGGGGGNPFVSDKGGNSGSPVQDVTYPANPGISGFNDVPSTHWATKYIDALRNSKILNGYEDNTFKPENPMTRAEFVKILVEAFNISGNTYEGFNDVAQSDWYYPYIIKAKANGLITGANGNFYPNDNITRQDAAVMVYRFAKFTGKSFSKSQNKFADDSVIANYAKEAIYSLAGAGIIAGKGNNSYAPSDEITRAEAAKIIYCTIYGGEN